LRRASFLLAMFAAVLCVSGIIGSAAAEPQKNQITVEASCKNGQDYTFVINGMSKTGDVVASTKNVVVKHYIVDYFSEDGSLVGSDVYGEKKASNEDDLISCTGTTETVLQGLGPVRAIYDFRAFVTPRGQA
jgi:hypothetical protein